jgi:hypothetical protein
MNKPQFTSSVKKRFEYQEAKPTGDDDPTNPNSPAYNFAAKFHKNREATGGKKSGISGGGASGRESMQIRESLVVENDPQAVRISFDRPPSAGYKAFVKSYLVDTNNWCVFGTSALLILLAIAVGVIAQILSAQVTEYVIDYATL